jgi:8-oxo-dGTP diphosphatase
MIKVTAAVIEKDGKILIAKRKKGDHLEHKWEFPGGTMNPGESPEECLKRELLEELGIGTTVGDFICSSTFDYGHVSIELLAYKVSHVSGNFQLHDHEEIEWVFPRDLIKYEFPEADAPIIARLIDVHHQQCLK